jgi:hypothetical protein
VGIIAAALFMNLVPIFAMLIGVGPGRPLLLSQLAVAVLAQCRWSTSRRPLFPYRLQFLSNESS